MRRDLLLLLRHRYDPYGRVLTEEHYDHKGMRQARRKAIETAQKAKHFGLILGTLGRQGNPRILDHLQGIMQQKGISFTVVCPHLASDAHMHTETSIQAFSCMHMDTCSLLDTQMLALVYNHLHPHMQTCSRCFDQSLNPDLAERMNQLLMSKSSCSCDLHRVVSLKPWL